MMQEAGCVWAPGEMEQSSTWQGGREQGGEGEGPGAVSTLSPQARLGSAAQGQWFF